MSGFFDFIKSIGNIIVYFFQYTMNVFTTVYRDVQTIKGLSWNILTIFSNISTVFGFLIHLVHALVIITIIILGGIYFDYILKIGKIVLYPLIFIFKIIFKALKFGFEKIRNARQRHNTKTSTVLAANTPHETHSLHQQLKEIQQQITDFTKIKNIEKDKPRTKTKIIDTKPKTKIIDTKPKTTKKIISISKSSTTKKPKPKLVILKHKGRRK